MAERIVVNFVLPILLRHPVGGYRVVFDYANHLAERGVLVNLIFPRSNDAKQRTRLQRVADVAWRIKVRTLDRPLIPWHRLSQGVSCRLVGSLAELRLPTATATVATAWETAGAVAEASQASGRKFYFIQHYEEWAGNRVDVDETWRLPLKKIVIARWLERKSKELGAGPCTYVSNGLDTTKFRVRRPINSRPAQIVTLQHHEPFKGVADAVAALKEVHRRVPAVRVLMFGTAPRPIDLPSFIDYSENPAQDVLVDTIYNGSSIYLGASTAEGWGLPPAEAMACGCAFVGTDIGGFQEFARHERNALLSPPGRPDLLAENLLTLLADRDRLLRMQEFASADLKAYTLERAGAQFAAALELPPLRR